MSKAKFAAAKELIQEKNYEAARTVLQTMDDPSARQWLHKLDQIAPPFPVAAPMSKEQERFFRNQNRDRRRWRIGNGLRLIGMAIVSFFLFAVFAGPEFANNDGSVHLGIEVCLLPLGVLGLLGGLVFIFKD